MTIRDFVFGGNNVWFDYYRAGYLYYWTFMKGTSEMYSFPVPIDDIGGATLLSSDKAITFMRWIRKAIEDNTMVKTKSNDKLHSA